jgi:hypothetical protein
MQKLAVQRHPMGADISFSALPMVGITSPHSEKIISQSVNRQPLYYKMPVGDEQSTYSRFWWPFP